jgi:Reverse transcriptase (RNA-dependent DNA polymerase).
MMEYGEQRAMLAPEQFGSRKNLSAIEHATNKRLVLDILRQAKQNAVYIANDAKSCYDRIILMVAYLTMRNFGIPALAAKSTISTILEMQHRVRTCYGDSDEYYGGDKWETKPHGCGQGNGYGPALWACISSPLLHILRNKGYGTKIQQPITRFLIHLAAFAFVDDTDIIQTDTNDDVIINDPVAAVSELFQATQGAIDTWSSLLRATGGELEPSKTFCVPIIHTWRGHRPVLQTKSIDNPQIRIRSSNDQSTVIQKTDPNDSFFTLGIWQSPSGDETKQKRYLLEKIHDWNHKTNHHKLTWGQAQIASRATIGKTLQFPLSATTFDTAECKELQRRYIAALLGKMGVVRTAPAVLATAPRKLGGFGLLAFEIEQLISHLGIILQHGYQHKSITGSLLRATFEYHALEVGLAGDPLQLPDVPYVTQRTWVSNTIKTMHKYRVKIISDIPGLSTWTTNDTLLMNILGNIVKDSNTLQILNKVRLYLRVVTVSDLVSADGKKFDINIISGNRNTEHPNPSYFRYCWPKIPPPTRIDKEVWYQYLGTALGIINRKPGKAFHQ